jgi:hypothetical protein
MVLGKLVDKHGFYECRCLYRYRYFDVRILVPRSAKKVTSEILTRAYLNSLLIGYCNILGFIRLDSS